MKTNMADQKILTMKDIAKMLNVSVATVSRALKDSPNISREQREKIQKFAREHNYYPCLLYTSALLVRLGIGKHISVVFSIFAKDSQTFVFNELLHFSRSSLLRLF